MNPEEIHREFLVAYDTHADAIFRHCFYRCSDREVAKELTQDVFMRTWEYISSGHPIENMRAFLYRIAHNLIVDHYKKRKEVSLEQLVETGFQPESEDAQVSEHIDARALVMHLERLDGPHRTVLVMRYLDGFSPKEIAACLGESANVVSVRINRALEKLRKMIPTS